MLPCPIPIYIPVKKESSSSLFPNGEIFRGKFSLSSIIVTSTYVMAAVRLMCGAGCDPAPHSSSGTLDRGCVSQTKIVFSRQCGVVARALSQAGKAVALALMVAARPAHLCSGGTGDITRTRTRTWCTSSSFSPTHVSSSSRSWVRWSSRIKQPRPGNFQARDGPT
jgi:hypothetical protein